MPRPIPPPPPQPTVEETAAGVRLVYALVALALAVFGALTLTYRVDSPIVHYGRQFAISWNLWKLDRLDEGAARAHPGGRIAWLVGSSILRESFDVAAINAALEERGSEWRVQKFGLNSGAAGLSWGVARRLPIREGDRLIHGVQIENFQRDWLSFAQLPHWMLGAALTLDELWDVEELTVQEKLEQTVAIPRSFWTFHDEYQAGLTAWLLAPWYMKVPEVRERNYHVSYHPRLETHERLGRMRGGREIPLLSGRGGPGLPPHPVQHAGAQPDARAGGGARGGVCADRLPEPPGIPRDDGGRGGVGGVAGLGRGAAGDDLPAPAPRGLLLRLQAPQLPGAADLDGVPRRLAGRSGGRGAGAAALAAGVGAPTRRAAARG